MRLHSPYLSADEIARVHEASLRILAETGVKVHGELGLPLTQGGYAFATVHRAENRDPDAMRAWASILADAAAVRPVVLALHPGTRAAI